MNTTESQLYFHNSALHLLEKVPGILIGNNEYILLDDMKTKVENNFGIISYGRSKSKYFISVGPELKFTLPPSSTSFNIVLSLIPIQEDDTSFAIEYLDEHIKHTVMINDKPTIVDTVVLKNEDIWYLKVTFKVAPKKFNVKRFNTTPLDVYINKPINLVLHKL